MKKKIFEEWKSLSLAELESKLRETRQKLFELKFQHQVSPLKNPLEIRNLRRNIARLLTLIKMKKEAKL